MLDSVVSQEKPRKGGASNQALLCYRGVVKSVPQGNQVGHKEGARLGQGIVRCKSKGSQVGLFAVITGRGSHVRGFV